MAAAIVTTKSPSPALLLPGGLKTRASLFDSPAVMSVDAPLVGSNQRARDPITHGRHVHRDSAAVRADGL